MSTERIGVVEIKTEKITRLGDLQRGDHLAVRGQIGNIEYYHHGIYLGGIEHKVADFGGTNKMEASPRIVDILEFKGERILVRISYKNVELETPEDAARKAEELVRDRKSWGKYNLLMNNCEHFANWCVTKSVKVSFQVTKALYKAIEYLLVNPSVICASISISINTGLVSVIVPGAVVLGVACFSSLS